MSAPAISAHSQAKHTSRGIQAGVVAAVDPTVTGAARYRPGVLVMINSMLVGGAEKHAISLVNHLDTARFRIGLCHLKPDGNLARELDTARLDTSFSLNVTSKLDWRAVQELTRRIDAEQIDVIVCTNGYPLLYALIASRRARRQNGRFSKSLLFFNFTEEPQIAL